MSGVIVPKYMSDISELYFESQVIFDALTECMSMQPDIDPEAGYGIFQIPTLFLNLQLDTLDGERLIGRLGYDSLKLYIFIRSHYVGAFPKNELIAFLKGEIDLDLKTLYKDLLVFVPKFVRVQAATRLS